MDDGQIGGSKFVVPHGSIPLIQGNTSNHRATIPPLVAATGEPVVCAVIFASDRPQIDASWHSGISITVDPIVNSNNSVDAYNRNNFGPGKYFPMGPVCTFRGKKIQTLTFTSPSGTISAQILVRIFSVLDELQVYPRRDTCDENTSPPPEPCVVVDDHQSRLDTSLLLYINDEGHKWNFALGVPYLTDVWQVGDSPEMNGSFKTEFYRAKEDLMSFKIRRGMPAKLNATDIMPLVNIAWNRSFAKIESNRKAISTRGWYPPTRKVLQDP